MSGTLNSLKRSRGAQPLYGYFQIVNLNSASQDQYTEFDPYNCWNPLLTKFICTQRISANFIL